MIKFGNTSFLIGFSNFPQNTFYRAGERSAILQICPLFDDKLRHNIVKVAVEITRRRRVISTANFIDLKVDSLTVETLFVCSLAN